MLFATGSTSSGSRPAVETTVCTDRAVVTPASRWKVTSGGDDRTALVPASGVTVVVEAETGSLVNVVVEGDGDGGGGGGGGGRTFSVTVCVTSMTASTVTVDADIRST